MPRHYWIETLGVPVATLLGVGFATLGVVLTVDSNNSTERAREAAAAQVQANANQAAFQLAAAQIVMAQPSCKLAEARARELVLLFPERLNTTAFRRFENPLSKALCLAIKQSPFWPIWTFAKIPGMSAVLKKGFGKVLITPAAGASP